MTDLEVLYFDGCPSHELLLPLLRALAGEHGLQLIERRIADAAQAERARFLGSPSVRVNGVDVEPGAETRTDFGMNCRLYRSPDGQSGLPREEWIRRALDRASDARRRAQPRRSDGARPHPRPPAP